ncbi:hypothetical protein [Laceyella putida]|uniref:Uncharacterized protein n=1 Tax=Laceyella putida TaxID=110101 RepID=A0ABW2RH30_9BACL
MKHENNPFPRIEAEEFLHPDMATEEDRGEGATALIYSESSSDEPNWDLHEER